jgi:hypothetical protein
MRVRCMNDKYPYLFYFYEGLLNPEHIFDYLDVLYYILIEMRLIEVIEIVIKIPVLTEKDKIIMLPVHTMYYIPVESDTIGDEILRKYSPMLDKLLDKASVDIVLFFDMLYRAVMNEVSSTETNMLKDFIGDELWGEFSWLLKNKDSLRTKQKEEFVLKYLQIVVQRIIEKITHTLGENGIVMYDKIAPNTFIISWAPRQGLTTTSVDYAPKSKLQLLSILRDKLPGLIDFSTEENEFTRLARLAVRIEDNYDLDTLIQLITKLYLEPSEMWLLEELKEARLPKRTIALSILSFAQGKRNNCFTLIDFEGSTPIIIMYPQIPFQTKGIAVWRLLLAPATKVLAKRRKTAPNF